MAWPNMSPRSQLSLLRACMLPSVRHREILPNTQGRYSNRDVVLSVSQYLTLLVHKLGVPAILHNFTLFSRIFGGTNGMSDLHLSFVSVN